MSIHYYLLNTEENSWSTLVSDFLSCCTPSIYPYDVPVLCPGIHLASFCFQAFTVDAAFVWCILLCPHECLASSHDLPFRLTVNPYASIQTSALPIIWFLRKVPHLLLSDHFWIIMVLGGSKFHQVIKHTVVSFLGAFLPYICIIKEVHSFDPSLNAK